MRLTLGDPSNNFKRCSLLLSFLHHCLISFAHLNSELSTNNAEQQRASADSSEGIEVDKKLEEYKVGEEVNCFVKSVRLTGRGFVCLFVWLFVFSSIVG